MITVRIEGKITINDIVAEALKYLMCSGYVEAICKDSNRYSVQQMNAALQPLSQEINEILESRRLAINGINEQYKKRKSPAIIPPMV